MKPIPSRKPGLSRKYTPERLEKGKEKETKRVSPTTQKRIEEAKQRRKEQILSRGPSGPSTPITGKRPLLSDEEEQLEKKMRTGVEEMEGTRPTTDDEEEEELATILRKIYIHDWRILRTEMKDNKSDFAILPKTTTAQ